MERKEATKRPRENVESAIGTQLKVLGRRVAEIHSTDNTNQSDASTLSSELHRIAESLEQIVFDSALASESPAYVHGAMRLLAVVLHSLRHDTTVMQRALAALGSGVHFLCSIGSPVFEFDGQSSSVFLNLVDVCLESEASDPTALLFFFGHLAELAKAITDLVEPDAACEAIKNKGSISLVETTRVQSSVVMGCTLLRVFAAGVTRGHYLGLAGCQTAALVRLLTAMVSLSDDAHTHFAMFALSCFVELVEVDSLELHSAELAPLLMSVVMLVPKTGPSVQKMVLKALQFMEAGCGHIVDHVFGTIAEDPSVVERILSTAAAQLAEGDAQGREISALLLRQLANALDSSIYSARLVSSSLRRLAPALLLAKSLEFPCDTHLESLRKAVVGCYVAAMPHLGSGVFSTALQQSCDDVGTSCMVISNCLEAGYDVEQLHQRLDEYTNHVFSGNLEETSVMRYAQLLQLVPHGEFHRLEVLDIITSLCCGHRSATSILSLKAVNAAAFAYFALQGGCFLLADRNELVPLRTTLLWVDSLVSNFVGRLTVQCLARILKVIRKCVSSAVCNPTRASTNVVKCVSQLKERFPLLWSTLPTDAHERENMVSLQAELTSTASTILLKQASSRAALSAAVDVDADASDGEFPAENQVASPAGGSSCLPPAKVTLGHPSLVEPMDEEDPLKSALLECLQACAANEVLLSVIPVIPLLGEPGVFALLKLFEETLAHDVHCALVNVGSVLFGVNELFTRKVIELVASNTLPHAAMLLGQVGGYATRTNEADIACSTMVLEAVSHLSGPRLYAAAAFKTISTLLDTRQWHLDDVVRLNIPILRHKNLERVCECLEIDFHLFFAKHWDLILPELIMAGTLEEISALTSLVPHDKQHVIPVPMASVMAWILMSSSEIHSTSGVVSSVPDTIKKLDIMSHYFNKGSFVNIPSSIDKQLQHYIMALMSPNVCVYKRLPRALHVLLSVAKADADKQSIEAALTCVRPLPAAQETIIRCIFDVIDRVSIALGLFFHDVGATTMIGGDSAGCADRGQVSVTTKSQWIKSLGGLLEFMGHGVNVIGAKVMTILAECAVTQQLWGTISEVWLALISSLTADYLVENGPSIAVEMIGFEQHGISGLPLQQLSDAFRLLYDKTREASFWAIFGSALRIGSTVIRSVLPSASVERDIPSIISGCAEGLSSSSMRCREVFVKGLKSVLESFVGDEECAMSQQCTKLIAPLLRCCRDGVRTSSVALTCLGLIGAKSIGVDESVTLPRERFMPSQVLKWDQLVQELLDTYCSAALGATSDPSLHDRAAFAIQTLLSTCANQERKKRIIPELADGEELTTTELMGYSWWRNLSRDKQAAFTAFTTTRFQTKIVIRNEATMPVFSEGMHFQEWLSRLYRTLISRTTNIHGRIFESVRNVAKRDVSLCLFLIPHVVINVVLFGEAPQAEEVRLEFLTVLRTGGEEHIQQIFTMLDCLKSVRLFLRRGAAGMIDAAVTRELVPRVESFVSALPQGLCINAAMRANCFARALMVIESSLEMPKVSGILTDAVDLQQIFAQLQDKDSSRVVHNHAEHRDWGQEALSLERNGEYALAVQCCELHFQEEEEGCESVDIRLCALRCMKQLGQLHLMTSFAKSLAERYNGIPQHSASISAQAFEAAWRLGDWGLLENSTTPLSGMSLSLRELSRFREGKVGIQEVFAATHELRCAAHGSLLSSSKEGYSLVFPHLVTLHAARDIELVADALLQVETSIKSHAGSGARPPEPGCFSTAAARRIDELSAKLGRRLDLIHPSEPSRELIVSLHRVVYDMLGQEDRSAEMCMEYAKLLRDSGHLQAALNAVRQVDRQWAAQRQHLFRMHAQLLWVAGEKQKAVAFATRYASDEQCSKNVRAELLLQATIWRQVASSDTTAAAVKNFKLVLELSETEEAHFEFAMFLDKNFTALQNRAAAQSGAKVPNAKSTSYVAVENYLMPLLDHFARSLRLGRTKLFTSLPRLLQRWLDMAANFTTDAAPARITNALHQLMMAHLSGPEAISTSVLIAALPQLVSRLGHPRQETQNLLARVVTALLHSFPYQALWAVLPLVFSASSRGRSEFVSSSILKSFEQWSRSNHSDPKILERGKAIFHCLIDICNASPNQFGEHGRLTQMPYVKMAMPLIVGSQFIIPTQRTLTPTIPVDMAAASFPVEPTFHGFDDRVDIMASIQKPKKVGVITNTGEKVLFLCKAKDEPRKDMRMMELAALLNNIFQQSPASHHRRFALRRYSVTALQDDCGIIEWVGNTTTLRAQCDDMYHQRGLGLRISQLKDIKEECEKRKGSKLEMLTTRILPQFPPSLHLWLQQSFHQPSQWYEARMAFTQSVALWSMVGHVVGLGDRHGENLLIDTKRGEVLHVDFASLFDAAEKLQVPEKVRFRLTPNLVDAMGVTGSDGPFRSCCEIALQTQVSNRDALMGVLETFLHDPLVEWGKNRSDASPKLIFKRVARRLDGFLDLLQEPIEPIALNIEGQVEKLITHCSSLETLCEMYFWWMPWI